MTNKIQNNLVYFFGIGLISSLTFLLNKTTTIYQCAAVFTFIGLSTNALTMTIGKKNALTILAISTLASFAVLWQLPYYVNGKIINGMIAASYCSLLVSLYWSSTVFASLKDKVSIAYSAFVSLVLAAVIDGFVMSMFYAINNKFSYARILDILTREVSYKALYAMLACAIIAYVMKVSSKQIREL